MAIEIERLIATLEANFSKYDRALTKALGNTDSAFTRIEKRGKQLESRLSSLGGNLGKGLLGFLAGSVSLRGAQQLIDTATRIQNALKVAGLSGDELTAVYNKLFASAQRNAAPIETLVQLYSRASLVQKDLNVSTEQLLNFTDKVALALRVSGQSAEESSGALLQLAQLLGSGKVRAEEFNSVQEGALPILQAVAAGLREAGGSVSELRALVIAGKVSSEAFFKAFEAGSGVLEGKVAGASLTVGQAFTKLNNTLVDSAGKINAVVGASTSAVELLDRLAGIVSGLSNVFEAAASGPIGNFIGRLSQLNDLVRSILPGFSALGLVNEDNLNKLAGAIGPSAGPSSVPVNQSGKGDRVVADPIQSRIEAAFGGAAIKTVSINDFKVPATSSGSKSKKTRLDDFQRETAQIKERTAVLQAETASQAALNPLIDDYGYSLEKAKATQELLSAAEKAHIAITPELRANIDALAEGYAQASAEAERLKESQDRARQTAQEFSDLGKDVLGGFISDLRNGTSAAEALRSALNKVLDKLIDIGLNSLFGKGGLISGGGGLLGGAIIPGILHSGGVAGSDGYGHGRAVSPSMFAGARRMHSGGVAGLRSGEVPAILKRGEIVTPAGQALPAASNTPLIIHLVGEEGDLFTPRVTQISGQTAGVVVQQSRPQLARDSVNSIQSASRNRPGLFRS